MRDNSPPPIYAIVHGAVSRKGYFALALVKETDGTIHAGCSGFNH